MDMPALTSPPGAPDRSYPRSRAGLRRGLRVGVILGLMLLAQGTAAYLLSWIDPPREPFCRTIDFSHGATQFRSAAWLAGHAAQSTDHAQIEAIFAELAACGESQPVLLTVRAPALPSASGALLLVTTDDLAAALPLADVLRNLRDCPARQKLLILDLAPPLPDAWSGYVHHDITAAITRELDALPDPHRLVLCPCAAGQTPHGSAELGQSAFAHYVEEGLSGRADGFGGERDGRITVKELAGFVQARVERWSWQYRGARQTPTLLGQTDDFVIAGVHPGAGKEPTITTRRDKPEAFARAWKERDRVYQTGQYRLAARRFQMRQALLQAAWRDGSAPPDLGRTGTLELAKLSEAMKADPGPPVKSAKLFDERWRILRQQLADARPADAERIKKRFVEQMRGALTETDLDAVVFAQAIADGRSDPGTIRLYDQLLHPTPQAPPRSAETLRIRQLADLAMRVEVSAWPGDLVALFLRCTELGEKAAREFPYMPGYLDRLAEPMQARHDGEIRLLTHGYANLEEAKKSLTSASEQFTALLEINGRWRDCEQTLDEAYAELPWYFEAMEEMPALREAWLSAASAAASLASIFEEDRAAEGWWQKTELQRAQVLRADAAVKELRLALKLLHEPLGKEALDALERECQSAQAGARTLRRAGAILSIAGPNLAAEERVALGKAAQRLSRRLHDEIMALDQQDDAPAQPAPLADERKPANEESRARCQLAVLELAGVDEEHLRGLRQKLEQCVQEPARPLGWCELGGQFSAVIGEEMPARYEDEPSWRRRERLAWLLPPWRETAADRADLSPTAEQRTRDKEKRLRVKAGQQRYLAAAFQTLNFECPGIMAARRFYSQPIRADVPPIPQLRFGLTSPVEPLTQKQPTSQVFLEVTRQVPPGKFGPVELEVHRPDDVWLEISPESATLAPLTDAGEARTLFNKVPLKVNRLSGAERTGLPPPLGFLIEARADGRTWHHLATAPIVPITQLAQIIVSTDPDEPGNTVNDIRIRPGKIKQPHYFYVRNLTNRPQKVHVEIKAGSMLLHKTQKPMLLDADAVAQVRFGEAAVPMMALGGPIVVRVLDEERHKLLHERSLRVEILPPSEYVKTADATYDPGSGGANRFTVQVQAARSVAGPAIAAQLVLPAQRIPGFISVGGGTLHADVPAQAETPRVLFAENIRLIGAGQEEAPIYVHIDGVPRAFVYRTTFTRAGAPVQAQADDRPAVRIAAPPCIMSGVNCLVDVEVDNAPPGTKLEVALGRSDNDGGFKPELTREFAQAKKSRIDVEGAKDALVFTGSLTDWTATFDTRNIVGARELAARLIDQAGQPIAMTRQPIVLDDTPPVAKIAPTPAQVKGGTVLQIQAQGSDAESGVAQVIFFFGRPDKGEVPAGAPRFKAIPSSREGSVWRVPLLIPADHKGPLAISVQVVNHAGMVSSDTVTVEVTEREPGKTGLGEIHGQVTEGPRPQPNLLVTLLDERGKEIAHTRTQPDGAYRFSQLPPGRYRVIAVKPESQRRASQDVNVEADRPTRTDLALAL